MEKTKVWKAGLSQNLRNKQTRKKFYYLIKIQKVSKYFVKKTYQNTG